MILDVEPDIEVVGEAADGEEAVRLRAGCAPDVVLMDIRMPGMDGIEATRRIPPARPRRRGCSVLTTFDLDEYVYDALRAGASGFLLKDVRPSSSSPRIRVVAARRGAARAVGHPAPDRAVRAPRRRRRARAAALDG